MIIQNNFLCINLNLPLYYFYLYIKTRSFPIDSRMIAHFCGPYGHHCPETLVWLRHFCTCELYPCSHLWFECHLRWRNCQWRHFFHWSEVAQTRVALENRLRVPSCFHPAAVVLKARMQHFSSQSAVFESCISNKSVRVLMAYIHTIARDWPIGQMGPHRRNKVTFRDCIERRMP